MKFLLSSGFGILYIFYIAYLLDKENFSTSFFIEFHAIWGIFSIGAIIATIIYRFLNWLTENEETTEEELDKELEESNDN